MMEVGFSPLPQAAGAPLTPSSIGQGKKEGSLKKAAQAFEAYFINSLLQEMRKSIPAGGFLGSGVGQGIYQAFFDEALADNLAERGGLGLARLLIQKYGDQAGDR